MPCATNAGIVIIIIIIIMVITHIMKSGDTEALESLVARGRFCLYPANSIVDAIYWRIVLWTKINFQPDPAPVGIEKVKSGATLTGFNYFKSSEENLFSDHTTIHLIKLMVKWHQQCCQLAAIIQFRDSFDTPLFASFWRNLWSGNECCISFVQVTVITRSSAIAGRPCDAKACQG